MTDEFTVCAVVLVVIVIGAVVWACVYRHGRRRRSRCSATKKEKKVCKKEKKKSKCKKRRCSSVCSKSPPACKRRPLCKPVFPNPCCPPPCGAQGSQGAQGAFAPSYAEFQFNYPAAPLTDAAAPAAAATVGPYGVQGMPDAATNNALTFPFATNTIPGAPTLRNFIFDATLIPDPTGNITINPGDTGSILIRDGGVYEISYFASFTFLAQGTLDPPSRLQLVLFVNSDRGTLPDYSVRTSNNYFPSTMAFTPATIGSFTVQQTTGAYSQLTGETLSNLDNIFPLPPNSVIRFSPANGFFGSSTVQGLTLITYNDATPPFLPRPPIQGVRSTFSVHRLR